MNEITSQENPLFSELLAIQEMDTENLVKAHKIFDTYKFKGVFKDCNFEDTKWHSTDEYSNVGIHFNFNELSYNRWYRDVFKLDYLKFVNFVKVYVTYTLGKNILRTLQKMVNDLKRLIKTDINALYGASIEMKITVPNLCIDFITLLPSRKENAELDDLLEILDMYISVNYRSGLKRQRQLAQFDSYFLFNDIMNDFWEKPMKERNRLFFYPLYLWWKITAVIPLRPKEFILTRRDCLEKREEGYFLTLQRNNLKGSKKNVSYKLNEDYYQVTYQIPDKLALEIAKYLRLTKEFDNTDIGTLFVSDTHYQRWNQKKHSNSRFLTYNNLSTVMRYFFRDVIQDKYNLEIIYGNQKGHLNKNQINYLHLGDTRHIALINLMAEGGTPVTAMMLAGHDNIEMSAHYYSNISNLIECQTYRQYRLITKGEVNYQISTTNKSPLNLRNQYAKLLDGGRCYSVRFQKKDFSDCMAVSGKNGEIGYCEACPFYRRPGKSYYSSNTLYKRNIEDDCKLLESAVHQLRLGKGSTEDIGEAMLKLKTSSYSYQRYWNEKIQNRQRRGEDIWEEKD